MWNLSSQNPIGWYCDELILLIRLLGEARLVVHSSTHCGNVFFTSLHKFPYLRKILPTLTSCSDFYTKMHMWFWFSSDLGNFLFPGYQISSAWGLFATCLGLVSLAVVYEAMKVLQIKLHRKSVAIHSEGASNSENSSLLTQVAPGTAIACTPNWKKWSKWLVEVLHWSTHTTLGYLLMLAVMTYNGYVGIALVIGASLGYWIFGMTLIELNLDQYRRSRIKVVPCDPECADGLENTERRPSAVSVVAEQLVSEAESITAVESIAEIHVPSQT